MSFPPQVEYWLDFLMAMTTKEIQARYKRAVLGFLWILLNPLLQMIVMGVIFQFFIKVPVDNYFLFLFSGLLPWNFFSYSVSKNTPMLIHERNLIKKAKFPRETIILSVVLSNLFHFLIALSMLILLLIGDKIFSDHYSFLEIIVYIFRMLWIIPVVGLLAFFTSGFALLTSSLNVKFRDMDFFVQAVMPLWFYATPIVFTLQLLPKPLNLFFYINPMTGILELFHKVLLNSPVLSLPLLLLSLAIGTFFSVLGIIVFLKEAPYFDDWM